jgi:hypothetical protein
MALLRGAPMATAGNELSIDVVPVNHVADRFVSALQRPLAELPEIDHIVGPMQGLALESIRAAREAEGYECKSIAEKDEQGF